MKQNEVQMLSSYPISEIRPSEASFRMWKDEGVIPHKMPDGGWANGHVAEFNQRMLGVPDDVWGTDVSPSQLAHLQAMVPMCTTPMWPVARTLLDQHLCIVLAHLDKPSTSAMEVRAHWSEASITFIREDYLRIFTSQHGREWVRFFGRKDEQLGYPVTIKNVDMYHTLGLIMPYYKDGVIEEVKTNIAVHFGLEDKAKIAAQKVLERLGV